MKAATRKRKRLKELMFREQRGKMLTKGDTLFMIAQKYRVIKERGMSYQYAKVGLNSGKLIAFQAIESVGDPI